MANSLTIIASNILKEMKTINRKLDVLISEKENKETVFDVGEKRTIPVHTKPTKPTQPKITVIGKNPSKQEVIDFVGILNSIFGGGKK